MVMLRPSIGSRALACYWDVVGLPGFWAGRVRRDLRSFRHRRYISETDSRLRSILVGRSGILIANSWETFCGLG